AFLPGLENRKTSVPPGPPRDPVEEEGAPALRAKTQARLAGQQKRPERRNWGKGSRLATIVQRGWQRRTALFPDGLLALRGRDFPQVPARTQHRYRVHRLPGMKRAAPCSRAILQRSAGARRD